MFRPIKNFINYIQKNASGSAIFGSSTTIADIETETDAEEVGIDTTKKLKLSKEKDVNEDRPIEEISICGSELIKKKRNNKKMKRIQINKVKLVNGNSATVGVAEKREINGISVHADTEDDIELQIKSSVMLRQPLKPISAIENLTDVADGDNDRDRDDIVDLDREESVDHPAHGSLLDRSDIDSQEDYDDYSHDVTEAISLVSDDGTAGGGEDTADEDITTEGEESFMDLTRDQEPSFEDSEIIVLNDTELNSSIASDAPSEDPLAIEEFPHRSISTYKDTSITLDYSTNDDASTSNDMLWTNINHSKTNKNTLTPNEEKDLKTQVNLIKTACSQNPQISTDKDINKTAASSSCSTSSTNNVILSTQSDEHAEELRSDGSDSGLGSETSTLQTTLVSLTDTSQLLASNNNSASNTPTANKSNIHTSNDYSSSGCSNNISIVQLTESAASSTNKVAVTNVMPPLTPAPPKPLRSNLKRRLEEDDALVDSVQHETQLATMDSTQVKKLKRSINFDNVQVYYFPRQQGFGCVPSAGGCTLGMGARHIGFKTLTLAEHAAEIRRAHRLQLQEINPRGSSSDDSEESEEDYLSEGSGSDLDAESNGFLQPVSPKQRRALLKAAGVRKIDATEKIECRDIRNSREVCGCTCVEFCDPETCACSQAGIKCQVDRAMFPCGCTRDACGNIVGRVEFNPTRVRTHFIHTIMRLEMENRQQQNPPLCSTMSSYSLSAACATSSTIVGPHANSVIPTAPSYANSLPGSYYIMQTQSNYSSGYASPAYTNEPAANYYQQQTTSNTTHFSAVNTTELQTSTQQNYQLDPLDGANLFTGTDTATPLYGEMLPSYSSSIGVSASTATVSAYHHQNINYSSVQQTQVSTYTGYQQASNSGYLAQLNASNASVITATPSQTTPPPTTYSSCAVPSLPPYGTATTTAAAAQYEDSSSYALVDTTAPSCITLDDSGGSDDGSDEEVGIVDNDCIDLNANSEIGVSVHSNNASKTHDNSKPAANYDNDNESGSNFIQLSTPISSATRLSQINDLLQHNRHTTATLVAVSHTTTTKTTTCLSVNSSTSATDKTFFNRNVTTDCDYNDNSNSILDIEESKEPSDYNVVIKREETVVIKEEQKKEIKSNEDVNDKMDEIIVNQAIAKDETPLARSASPHVADHVADIQNCEKVNDDVVTNVTMKAKNYDDNLLSADSNVNSETDTKAAVTAVCTTNTKTNTTPAPPPDSTPIENASAMDVVK